ncbi:MAG: hypothetical protein LBM23_05640 [Propionibacteriaceae bacterium]|jgi:hypothetical protein|nr:hypothetical protein [Propionibacteriaceae bacterium]
MNKPQCLERDKSWISWSKGALAQVRYDTPENAGFSNDERRAFTIALQGDYVNAAKEQQKVINDIEDSAIHGLHLQRLAIYTNFFDQSKAQQIQKKANQENRQLLRPLAGVQYKTPATKNLPQGKQASSWLQDRYSSGNDLLIAVNAMLSDLDWGPRTEQFEQSMFNLAWHIGHVGQQPERDLGCGPDGLWRLSDGTFYVIEAKSGADPGHPVYKSDAKQLSNSMDWFRKQYPDSKAVPLLIHPEEKFDSHAAIPPDCHVITTKRLEKLRQSVREFASGLVVEDAFRDPIRVTSLLNSHNLSSGNFLRSFSALGRK